MRSNTACAWVEFFKTPSVNLAVNRRTTLIWAGEGGNGKELKGVAPLVTLLVIKVIALQKKLPYMTIGYENGLQLTLTEI